MKNDIIIIGSGPGGYKAAEYAARNGLTVTIIEEREVGGTCLNRGCIPTKTLCRNAEIMDTLHDGDSFGIDNLQYTLDYPKVKAFKDQVVSQLRSGVELLMSAPGITLVRGHATFTDAHTVTVNGDAYEADHILIATGSHAKRLPIEGADQENVITSDTLLNIDSLPQRLCIVGAGVIGMEMASVFSSFGCEVTVVEFLKECLPMLDSDVAKRLRQSISKRGVTFHMQSGVKRIHDNTLFFERKGKEETVEADLFLMATGRGAHVEGFGLETTGVEYTLKGIPVDDYMQTNIPGIYAIGDVNGRQMLAHAAEFQGYRAINHILGKTDDIRLDIMPAAIFTHPEAASVGLTEEQCKTQVEGYQCRKGFFRANGKALAMHETDGMLKLLTDQEGTIIGCHAYGPHTADIIQEVSVLMCRHTNVHDLSQMIHIHPTLSEVIHEVSMNF